MRKRGSVRLIGLVIFMGIGAPSVLATNGYFSHGYGTVSKGMAGAGAALPLDTLTPATNPAGAVFVDPGLDVGIGVFSPDREYSVDGQPSGFPGTFGVSKGLGPRRSLDFAVP